MSFVYLSTKRTETTLSVWFRASKPFKGIFTLKTFERRSGNIKTQKNLLTIPNCLLTVLIKFSATI